MKQVLYFIVITLVIVFGYDLWLLSSGGLKATISWSLYELSYEAPIVPFLFGVVCGHLFWQMRKPKASTKLVKGGKSCQKN